MDNNCALINNYGTSCGTIWTQFAQLLFFSRQTASWEPAVQPLGRRLVALGSSLELDQPAAFLAVASVAALFQFAMHRYVYSISDTLYTN